MSLQNHYTVFHGIGANLQEVSTITDKNRRNPKGGYHRNNKYQTGVELKVISLSLSQEVCQLNNLVYACSWKTIMCFVEGCHLWFQENVETKTNN